MRRPFNSSPRGEKQRIDFVADCLQVAFAIPLRGFRLLDALPHRAQRGASFTFNPVEVFAPAFEFRSGGIDPWSQLLQLGGFQMRKPLLALDGVAFASFEVAAQSRQLWVSFLAPQRFELLLNLLRALVQQRYGLGQPVALAFDLLQLAVEASESIPCFVVGLIELAEPLAVLVFAAVESLPGLPKARAGTLHLPPGFLQHFFLAQHLGGGPAVGGFEQAGFPRGLAERRQECRPLALEGSNSRAKSSAAPGQTDALDAGPPYFRQGWHDLQPYYESGKYGSESPTRQCRWLRVIE